MPVWRMAAAEHDRMRAHKPFHHSNQADGSPHIVPMFHGLAEGQRQHDGSYIFHCSDNFAERLRREGFDPEPVHRHLIQYHEIHQELGRQVGIWSVWQALGGLRHKPGAEPSDAVKLIHTRLDSGAIDAATALAELTRLHAEAV